MKKLSISNLMIVGLVLSLYQTPASAITIGFNSTTQTVNWAEIFTMDVVVSGLASEIVSTFDLDVTYDTNILAATGVTFSSLLGDPAMFEADNGSVLTAGRIDLWEVSFLSDSELGQLQADSLGSFSLATLSFKAIRDGITNMLFDPNTIPGIDVKGLSATPLILDISAASVTVTGQSNPVPEPTTLWLCLLGFGVLVRRLNQTQVFVLKNQHIKILTGDLS